MLGGRYPQNPQNIPPSAASYIHCALCIVHCTMHSLQSKFTCKFFAYPVTLFEIHIQEEVIFGKREVFSWHIWLIYIIVMIKYHFFLLLNHLQLTGLDQKKWLLQILLSQRLLVITMLAWTCDTFGISLHSYLPLYDNEQKSSNEFLLLNLTLQFLP